MPSVSMEVAVPPLAGETFAGEKPHVELIGSAEQDRLTMELKPLRPARVTVKEPLCPAVMVSVAGETLIVKSGAGVALGTREANKPWASLARPAVMYRVWGSPDGPPPPKTMSQRERLVMTVPFPSFI